MKTTLATLAIIALLPLAAHTQAKADDANKRSNKPCMKVKEACEAAGFTKGQAKEGTGLWADCINPIMRGEAQPKNATKPLPTVDAAVVAACKAEKPNFGERHGKKHKRGAEEAH